MEGKHFEDFAAGDEYVSGYRVVAESDFRRFLDLAGIREPLFESRQYLQSSTEHDPWIVPGFLTLSFSLGLFTRSGWIHGTGLAMLGADHLAFEAPVMVGDEIRVRVACVETTRTSSDRGGVVTLEWQTENQDGETVLEMTSTHFIAKRE